MSVKLSGAKDSSSQMIRDRRISLARNAPIAVLPELAQLVRAGRTDVPGLDAQRLELAGS